MDRKWTTAQNNAINAVSGSVLVSAAAGSGKTAVLVERVIRLITRENDPVDVDRLLIVTFTRAAAAEMRHRLSEQISALLEGDPLNPRLLRQKLLMYNASICTIDSFCGSIVREYFHLLSVSGDFRIADDGELRLLSEEALNASLDKFYSERDPSFINLADAFASGSGDGNLRKAALKIAEFISTQPFSDVWLDGMLAKYDPDIPIAETVWGRTIINYAESAVSHLISLCESSASALLDEGDAKLSDALIPIINGDLSFLNKLAMLLGSSDEAGGWDRVKSCLESFAPARFTAPRGYADNPAKLSAAAKRDEFKKSLKALQPYFSKSEEEAAEEIARLGSTVEALFDLVRDYLKRLWDLKAEKNVLSFSDTELLAVRLLAVPNGSGFTKTEQAYEISKRFDFVMVDEFQDVNDVQDLIFRCVSTDEKNLFAVGDVKQSIYGFRQAKPEIFTERKAQYKRFDEKSPEYPAAIILDKNFRSRLEVCDAVNLIFEALMNNSSGGMEYSEEEYLKCGADYPESESCAFELDFIRKDGDGDDPCVREAVFVANKIHEMMKSGFTVKDGDGVRPAIYGDFAVIMRSTKNSAAAFVNTLNSLAVPAYSEIKEDFFSADEIKVMLNFLRIIDNPSRDIPMLSVMASPIYGFTPDELAKIRSADRYSNLYSAVLAYGAEDEKTNDFLTELRALKTISGSCTVDELIGRIYDRTAFPAIASAVKGGRRADRNLNLLREYARSYEANGYKGLSSFVMYMDRLIESGAALTSSSDTEGDSLNKVRVLSIHASKGLEFPVCFIADTARKFNKTDLREDVLIDSRIGLGIKRIDGFRRRDTFPRTAVGIEISDSEINEELRILYVALTRAKEKLIVLSSQKDPKEYIEKQRAKISELSGGGIDEYTVMNAGSISDWITLCSVLENSGKHLKWDVEFPSFENDGFDTENTVGELSFPLNISACGGEELVELLKRNVDFRYPNEALLTVPQKVTASSVSHEVGKQRLERVFTRPRFINTKISPGIERGNAHHAFLRYCDFKRAKADAGAETERLISVGRITREQANLIDARAISDFMHSPLADRIIGSPEVMREERFTVKLSAGMADESLAGEAANAKIVMQGAVDLAFVEDGKLVIVDYKTDRVKSLDRLRELYSKQLRLYKLAMEQSLEIEVGECIIYSIWLNSWMTVDTAGLSRFE